MANFNEFVEIDELIKSAYAIKNIGINFNEKYELTDDGYHAQRTINNDSHIISITRVSDRYTWRTKKNPNHVNYSMIIGKKMETIRQEPLTLQCLGWNLISTNGSLQDAKDAMKSTLMLW